MLIHPSYNTGACWETYQTENIVPADKTSETNRKHTERFKRGAETQDVYSEKSFKEKNSERRITI
jgi:hypothetical protein